ncbi:MAG: AAA family ATPase [Prochloraceae cyanobacterium]|nr:AAA family ATPase [Prochloraceae cyanobacterium]
MSDRDDEQLLDDLYNVFDPFEPLQAGDPKYVDCAEVRGDGNIEVDLGNRIRRAKRTSYYLYSGHRGGGKSTELLRLKKFLEEKNFYVVYFAADEEDIQSQDAQYTDILLACTRHLLEDLNQSANPNPLLEWVKNRVEELKDLAGTELSLQGLTVQAQISQVAKLTANLRAEPTMRQKIREKVNPHTDSLIEILNDFLKEAKQKLPDNRTKLAVIVDNLDRIVPIVQESGRTNHEEIFIDRHEQIKGLNCDLIYTVPISLLYSNRASDIRTIYDNIQVLPMIMVTTPEETIYQPGLNKIQEIISNRVNLFAADLSLEKEIFDSQETLDLLCTMSGGHVRELLKLVQDAIANTTDLPISRKAVRIAITEARDSYRRTVQQDQWKLLAEVHISKRIINDNKYLDLLFSRCLLEYRYPYEEKKRKRWCDVNPVIRAIPEFQEALDSLKQS